MSLKTEEKKRRSGKKMHEIFDEELLKLFEEDEDFRQESLKNWAKADPKGFMQIYSSRLPRVQPVDQDLLKNEISLKSILVDLPEVEDILNEYNKVKAENRMLTTRVSNLEEQVEFLNKKMQKMRAKNVESDNN
jgi:hypothetical protein